MKDIEKMVAHLKENIARVIVGKENVVELLLCALLCRGHVLIEDVPGVARPRWCRRWPGRWIAHSSAYSSRPT